MNFEIRIREGIRKLLTVSTQKDQLLQAVKNLMVCNARIHAYRTELQNQMEGPVSCRTGKWLSDDGTKDRMACRAKVALSDIRIPLMWKGSDHFNNKEKSQRYAVFCLFRMGAEVFDTEVAIVDKAITDICFENITIFDEAGPDFQVKVEVYSCCTEESLYVANTPKKLVKKLKTSLSKATGKKLKATLEEDGTDSILLSDPVIHGAKYSLLAYTTLGLESAKDSFRTHNLTITGNEESSFWLPLYGNMCCRLVAQPSCMARDMMTGFLNQQQMIGSLTSWRRLYCVLRGGKLSCYHSPEEIEAKVEPALRVSINKETRIQSVDKDSKRRTNSFSVINPLPGEAATQLFATDSREELQKWMEAFWQHFYDLSFGMVPPATREFAHLATVPSIHANTHCLLETGDSCNMMQVSGSKKSLKTNVLGKLGMIGQWKHCCEELMKIEIMSPRKPPLFLTKEATSVYHDMNWNCEDAQNAVWVIELLCIRAASSHNTTSAVNTEREASKSAIQKFHEGIDSPVKHEGLADITQRKIEESDGEFLLCQQKEPASSLWASLFDGSHEMVVQKNMHTASPNDGRGKKRRAPPPPSDKPAYNAKARGNAEERDKENWERPDGTSCSSLDSVLSMETQQLQAPTAAPRRICPCRKNSLADHRNPMSLVTKTESETKPVPTPRQKCITEALDPRSRLQPQT